MVQKKEKKKVNLPKSVYKFRDRFNVVFHSKVTKENLYAGSFETISDAIKARDLFVSQNINGFLLGYLPRGVSFNKKMGKYQASFTFQEKHVHIGSFSELDEAINARNGFIDSLK